MPPPEMVVREVAPTSSGDPGTHFEAPAGLAGVAVARTQLSHVEGKLG
jgi:hypothetical protein